MTPVVVKSAAKPKPHPERAKDSYGLRDKKVLITGASRGLGQICAEAFAREGARLVLAARAETRLNEIQRSLPQASKHQVFSGDLTRQEEIQRLIEMSERAEDIDVVLHVMGGGLGMRDPLLGWQEFESLFKTNVASAAEINRRVVPEMIRRKTGNIVHVGSIAGYEAVASVGYNTVKAALAAYTRSLGRQLAATGVIVTGIIPGGFWAPDNAWERLQRKDAKLVEKIIKERQPRGRLGNPEELIPIILFLASRQATMMTGCCVPVDGGEGITYVDGNA